MILEKVDLFVLNLWNIWGGCQKCKNCFVNLMLNFVVAAEGAVGHGSKKQEKSTLEGESERGGEGHGVGQKGDIMDSNQQQFCLKWNSFGSNLATAFSNLFKSESLTDVTLFCQGKFRTKFFFHFSTFIFSTFPYNIHFLSKHSINKIWIIFCIINQLKINGKKGWKSYSKLYLLIVFC